MRKLFIIFTILLSVLLLNGCDTPIEGPIEDPIEGQIEDQIEGQIVEVVELQPSELLADPVYGEDVMLTGKVSMLGELFCPCFQLGEGEDFVEAWYDLMAVDSDEPWSKVSVEGIENGDEVKITGQLRKNTGSLPSRTFWIRSIEKAD